MSSLNLISGMKGSYNMRLQILYIMLIGFFLATPVLAQQKASDEIKADPVIAAEQRLTVEEKDALIEAAKEVILAREKDEARAVLMERIEQMLEADPALRGRLRNE